MFNTSKESACPLSRKLNHPPSLLLFFHFTFAFSLPSISLWESCNLSVRGEWSRVEARGEENKGTTRETFSFLKHSSQQCTPTQHIDVIKVHCSVPVRFSQMKVWSHSSVKTCGRRKWTCLQMLQQEMFWAFWWMDVTWPPQLSVVRCSCTPTFHRIQIYILFQDRKLANKMQNSKCNIYTQWSSALIYLISYY